MPNVPEKKELIKMDEDSYKATVLRMEGVIQTEYQGVKRDKVIVKYNVAGNELQQWMTNAISEGGGKYSPSSLCIWLQKMGYYEEFMKNKAALLDDQKFIAWVNSKIEGTKTDVKVVVKNSNKGTDNEYSTVSEVLKRL